MDSSASGLSRWLTCAAAVFPASVYVGTQTVASAVLPEMQGDLSVGLDQISWVVTASVVASAIGIPPTAWLCARFGRRRLMMTCMVLFSAIAMMVGTADSLGGVVFWRIAASLSAAPILALSQSVTLDTFDVNQRGAALAFWACGVLSGWIFAPAIGAYIAEVHSWRLIFFLVGPVGLLAALSAGIPPETERNPTLRFDWFGFFALSLAIGSLLLVLNRGQRLDWFESPEVITFTMVGAIALYIFIVHTVFHPYPFLSFKIFLDRNYVVGLVIVSTYAGLSLAPLVLIPTMLEELRGLELLTTGLVLIPRGLAQIAGLLLVGAIVNKIDPRLLISFGFILFASACFDMARFNLDVGIEDIVWPNVVQGFAMAFIWAPAANLIYTNLPADLRTDATTFTSLVHTLATSIGVSVSVTILGRTLQISHEELASRVVPGIETLQSMQWTVPWRLTDVEGLAVIKAEVAQQALMIGYVNVYWATGIYALVVLPLALLLRLRK
jgi:DHA2 family multidrug resistance protein